MATDHASSRRGLRASAADGWTAGVSVLWDLVRPEMKTRSRVCAMDHAWRAAEVLRWERSREPDPVWTWPRAREYLLGERARGEERSR